MQSCKFNFCLQDLAAVQIFARKCSEHVGTIWFVKNHLSLRYHKTFIHQTTSMKCEATNKHSRETNEKKIKFPPKRQPSCIVELDYESVKSQQQSCKHMQVYISIYQDPQRNAFWLVLCNNKICQKRFVWGSWIFCISRLFPYFSSEGHGSKADLVSGQSVLGDDFTPKVQEGYYSTAAAAIEAGVLLWSLPCETLLLS